MSPFVLAVVAYLVPTFALGYVWHLVAFHRTYRDLGIYRPDMIIPFGFGAMLLQGLLFAWAYPRLFDLSPNAWLRSGLLAAAAFALLSWTYTTLSVAAKHPMTSVPKYVLMETAFTVVQFAMVGPLMAWVWKTPGR